MTTTFTLTSLDSSHSRRADHPPAAHCGTTVHSTHPDLRYTHSNAVVDTLDSYLAKCRDGFYVYHSVDHPIDKITVIGDVALVFGEMKADLTAGGTHKQLDNGSLAVWTRTGPTWRLLAFQPTVKPGAPTAAPGTGNASG